VYNMIGGTGTKKIEIGGGAANGAEMACLGHVESSSDVEER
jgi:hypothetical protein